MIELNIPAYLLGEERFGDSGESGLSIKEMYFGKEPHQNFWLMKNYGRDAEGIKLNVTQISPDHKGEKFLKEVFDELRLNSAELYSMEACEVSKSLIKAGEGFEKYLSLDETRKLLPVLYGRSSQVIDLEAKILLDGMKHNDHIAQAQVGGMEHLNSVRRLGTVYTILAGNTPVVNLQEVYRNLSKRCGFGKIARGDPSNPIAFAKLVGEVNATLGQSTAMIYFDGSANNLHKIAVGNSETTVAYGGFDAIENIGNLCRTNGKQFIDHGPRRTLVYIGEGNADTGRDWAYSYLPFEGHACLSPLLAFVDETVKEAVISGVIGCSGEFEKCYPSTPYAQGDLDKRNYWAFIPGVKIHGGNGSLRNRNKGFKIVELPYENLLNFSDIEKEMMFKDANNRFMFLIPVKSEMEVVRYLEKVEMMKNCPIRDHVPRVGASGIDDSLESYISEKMPGAMVCGVKDVSSIGLNEKHDRIFDLYDLIHPAYQS